MQVGDKVRDAGGRLGTVVDVWDPWSDGGVIDVDALLCVVQWNDLDYGDYRTHVAEHLVLASDQDRLDRNPHAKAAIAQGQADLENGDVVTIDVPKISNRDAQYREWLNSIEKSGVTPSLDEYRYWAEHDRNIDWKIGQGHINNLFEMALDELEETEKELEDVQGDLNDLVMACRHKAAYEPGESQYDYISRCLK